MKETYSLLCLNAWNARKWDSYSALLSKTKDSTDIYVFQEVLNGTNDVFSESGSKINQMSATEKILNPEHVAFINRNQYWRSKNRIYEHSNVPWGLAIMHGVAKKEMLFIDSWSNEFIIGHMNSCPDTELEANKIPVVLQKIRFVTLSKKRFWIINLHGYYAGNGGGKNDTNERIIQSKAIISNLCTLKEPWILCGDFNLRPETESIKMIENSLKCTNLIKEYKVQTTRTVHYGEKQQTEPFADYVFTKDMKIEHFHVDPKSMASDHAPMYLVFTL